MNPINPWVDAAEVRRLAERLLTPARQPDPTIRDAGFDADFIGYATERAQPAAASVAAVPPPAPARPQVIERTLPEEPPLPLAVESPFEQVFQSRTTARGPFLDRITRFRDWLVQEFSASGIFILDREGFVIFDESGNEKLHSLARNLALASRKPGSPPANVRLKIGTRATLEVIPVDTAYGYLVLGAIVPDILHPQSITAVMDALTRAASPPAAP